MDSYNSIPLIGVIIPTFNKGQYIVETIESALNQTYKNIEIIVIDDDSTDNTAEVLAKFINKEKIAYYHQQNKGPAAARNLGISLSKGGYILCLDSDDLLSPVFLENTISVLEADTTIGVVYTWIKTFGTEEGIIKKGEFNLFKHLNKNQVIVTALFRKKIWDDTGGFDEKIIGAEDWEFWIRVALKGWKFICVPEILFHYRRLPVSRNRQADYDYYLRAAYIHRKHRTVYPLNLFKLISGKPFGDIGVSTYMRFWIFNCFYICVPLWAQKYIYRIHRKWEKTA